MCKLRGAVLIGVVVWRSIVWELCDEDETVVVSKDVEEHGGFRNWLSVRGRFI